MLVVITLSAYAFAMMEFRYKNVLFAFYLSLMMIPNELVIITNFCDYLRIWDFEIATLPLFCHRLRLFFIFIC